MAEEDTKNENISNQNNNSENISNKDTNQKINFDNFNSHKHTGLSGDGPRLDPKYFLGWPVIKVADATVKPTDAAQDGVFRFYYDTVPVYRLWARINKDWHYISLT